jgi:hypothetical protein
MISVVCVYDKLDLYEEYLLASLRAQDTEHELIAVDNCHREYKSAAMALNYGGRRAGGNFIMFAHQDIRLQSSAFLRDAEHMLGRIHHLGIAGLAGKRRGGKVLTHLTHGDPPRLAGSPAFADITEIQTVDECLIFVPKTVFDTLEFDEHVCDGWHLYAVDYALSAMERGLRAIVLPLAAYHRSPGYSMTKDYYQTLKRVIAKHRTHCKWIPTSMGDWNTRLPVLPQRYRAEIRRRRLSAVGALSRYLRE